MTSPKRRLHKRRDPGICAEIGPIVRRVADGDGVTCDCCETLIPPGTPYRFATNWWVAGHSATCIRKAVYKAYAAFSEAVS